MGKKTKTPKHLKRFLALEIPPGCRFVAERGTMGREQCAALRESWVP